MEVMFLQVPYLSRFDGFDVAAGLGGEVDHHAAGLHAVDHVLLDQDWGFLSGDKSCGDHNINILK